MNTIRHEVAVGGTEPVFKGHFPSHPILPGVMLIAFARDALASMVGHRPRLIRIVRQRFIQPVLPDTVVTVECNVKETSADGYRVTCRWVLPDGSTASRGEFLMA